MPTGETTQFILAGNDLAKRLAIQRLLSNDPGFVWKRLLRVDSVPAGEPFMSGRLLLDSDVVELLTTGISSRPQFSMEFPAEYIETDMDWNDLVLHPTTLRQIQEIEHWITYTDTVQHSWGMKKKTRPGYRALFYGPPGTSKTRTVTLLGKQTGKDVFRIDLSRVVSKYIGETEKNLSRLFDKAEHKNAPSSYWPINLPSLAESGWNRALCGSTPKKAKSYSLTSTCATAARKYFVYFFIEPFSFIERSRRHHLLGILYLFMKLLNKLTLT